jgi:hypothetical protein
VRGPPRWDRDALHAEAGQREREQKRAVCRLVVGRGPETPTRLVLPTGLQTRGARTRQWVSGAVTPSADTHHFGVLSAPPKDSTFQEVTGKTACGQP